MRYKDFQIRRYKQFTVAECAMEPSAAADADPAGQGTSAFNMLADYLFGRNKQGVDGGTCGMPWTSSLSAGIAGLVMKMTTPVFSTSKGVMQFYVGAKAEAEVSCLHKNFRSTVLRLLCLPCRVCPLLSGKKFSSSHSPVVYSRCV